MNNSIIAYNPCGKCEKDNCNICELNMYRQGTLKKDKWISVDERLPEKDGEYIVHYHDDIVGEYVITRQFWEKPKMFAPMEWFEKNTGRKAVHWMPLPTPPKMKGADSEK